MSVTCFHCGEPLGRSPLQARVNDQNVSVCCAGCLAVAELIADAGFSQYYEVRSENPQKPDAALLKEDSWSAYAQSGIAGTIIERSGDHDSVTLGIDGLRCAACAWLIDKVVGQLDGVVTVSANTATGRVNVRWAHATLTLPDIMRTIARAGYRPFVPGDTDATQRQQRERRRALCELAVAGFGMMQVMMFAVADYSAQWSGETIEPELLQLFRVVSMLVATPVMFYAGLPILAGGLRSLRQRTLGMDVPVSLALILAYGASVYSTLQGNVDDLYFDSVTMFIFFVSLGRFVQMSVRHRTLSVTDALATQMPAIAHRVDGDSICDVPTSSLGIGDVVLVRRGEIVPGDGTLLDDEARLDESLLTGESAAVRRHRDEAVTGGTLNIGNPLKVRIETQSHESVLSHVLSLLQRAQAHRPVALASADRASQHFLVAVIACAVLTAGAWLIVDPSRAFAATLAVLVVACPCAFAIAMPAAVSAGVAALARRGLLVTNPAALETLAEVDRVVLDKTGTLTHGRVHIERCTPLADRSEAVCRELAATLEGASEHPIARAFQGTSSMGSLSAARVVAGSGIEGTIDGRLYRIGTREFVSGVVATPLLTALPDTAPGSTLVLLADERQVLAQFELQDELRASAASSVMALAHQRVTAEILSGDRSGAVDAVADACSISERHAQHSPDEKLQRLQKLQQSQSRVLVLGDGVNDAPMLGAADVSVAMGRGTALAHSSADMILINEDLSVIPEAVAVARRMRRIVRQNLFWAAAYNFGSLPLAALGFVPPWLAALGMSLSSIAVIVNATRLLPRTSLRPASSPQQRDRGPSKAPVEAYSS